MNIIIRILIGIMMIPTFYACENWLDVQPKTKIKSEKVFSKTEYFQQALIGVYLKLGEQSLYGQELSFYFMDAAAGLYDFKSGHCPYFFASKRDYTKSVNIGIINNIWGESYNTIANLNNILENIETQTCLDEVTANLIEGEARGLRAFIHLDLLRMFGPGNLAGDQSGMDELSIPYVKKYEKFLAPQLKTSQVLVEIHKDLDLAIELLNLGDTWGGIFPKEYEIEDDNIFLKQDRKFRFNYWAAIAIQARAYLWEGDHEKALLFAEKFINGSQDDIGFVREGDVLVDKDLGFSREYIFSLHVHDLYSKSNIKGFFEILPIFKNSDEDVMYISMDRFNAIYEAEGDGQSDLRANQFHNYLNKKVLYKYHTESKNSAYKNNRVALIRKPEMNYIAAECLNKLGKRREDAISYVNQVRLSRMIKQPITDTDDLVQEIEKEYYKDLFGEGQIFYFLKRLGYTVLPYTGETIDLKSLELPLPQSELDFGRE